MYDVIVIGGTTRDFFMISPDYQVGGDYLRLPWGEKTVASQLIKEVGGGGCNAAVAFARLGLKTALISRVGGDASGEVVAKRLREEGVALDLLQVRKEAQTSISFILTAPSGEHTIVMYRGNNDEVLDLNFSWDNLTHTAWLYLADVAAPQDDPSFKVADFAKEYGLKMAFVPGQHQLKRGVFQLKPVLLQTEVLILNIYEAQVLLGANVGPNKLKDSQLEAVDDLLKSFYRLGVKTAVITADIYGARAFDGKDFFFQEAPRVDKVVNTTGAGDAFAAGLIGSLIAGKSLRESLVFGSENAGSVLQQIGAQSGLIKRRMNVSKRLHLLKVQPYKENGERKTN